MNLSLPEDVLDQMALEQAHFDAAPQAFFEAWKRGAQIAGHEWFGDGTREGLQRATTKWDLRPNMLMLNDALGVLSSGQRMFLSAMVSFYNSREGGAMLKRCGFEGCPTSAASIWNGARSSLTSRCTTTAGEPRLATHRLFIPPHEGHASSFGAMSLLLFAGAAMSRITIFH